MLQLDSLSRYVSMAFLLAATSRAQETPQQRELAILRPTRTEVVTPKRTPTLDRDGKARERRQGGNPRPMDGLLVFDGPDDGYRQVDPQIAVGGGYVLTATNNGLIVYTKQGAYVRGVSQKVLNDGIDPKLFFDPHHRVFGLDLWVYWDDAKTKPVQISMSETDDPRGAWNTYPVPAPNGVDGGAIGYSKQWVGYSFPGGEERTFVMRSAALRSGEPATVWHFPGEFGQPVFGQDDEDALYFIALGRRRLTIRRVFEWEGQPVAEVVASHAVEWKHAGSPPPSPQKGTEQKTASGDRRPKNAVLQGGFLWFSHTVNIEGRAAVQWHQLTKEGGVVQSGSIASPTSSYIQTSLAVNTDLDVLVGFQETSPTTFISPRIAFRRAGDPAGTLRKIRSLGEGQGATDGMSWGDYSGSCFDGDDQKTLWTIQSITGPDGKGDTIVGKLPPDAR